MYSDLPRVRLDGGGRQFRRKWGYDAAINPASNTSGQLEDIDEDGDDYSDTYSLREETSSISGVHVGEGQTTLLFFLLIISKVSKLILRFSFLLKKTFDSIFRKRYVDYTGNSFLPIEGVKITTR